jgi:hypothetical protein
VIECLFARPFLVEPLSALSTGLDPADGAET